MAAKKRIRPKTSTADSRQSTQPPSATPNQPETPNRWSKRRRLIISIVLLVYLGILILGPLSNPVGSVHLTRPMAAVVAPVHRALFLGHGYRFFGPDPGPSHLLVYQGTRADGSTFNGQLPDRNQHWPRLLYHRWFMLSETIFAEQASFPNAQQLEQRNLEYDQRIEQLTIAGKLDLRRELIWERDAESEIFANNEQRFAILTQAIAQQLLAHHGGQTIELFLQERRIPLAEEFLAGTSLDSPLLLSELVKIAELDPQGFRTRPVDELPQPEARP